MFLQQADALIDDMDDHIRHRTVVEDPRDGKTDVFLFQKARAADHSVFQEHAALRQIAICFNGRFDCDPGDCRFAEQIGEASQGFCRNLRQREKLSRRRALDGELRESAEGIATRGNSISEAWHRLFRMCRCQEETAQRAERGLQTPTTAGIVPTGTYARYQYRGNRGGVE